jgi:hypothetical protein
VLACGLLEAMPEISRGCFIGDGAIKYTDDGVLKCVLCRLTRYINVSCSVYFTTPDLRLCNKLLLV